MEREAELKKWLSEQGRCAVAYSGGTDSTYLLKIAVDTLGADNVLPIRVRAQFHSRRENFDAKDFAKRIGVEVLEVPMDIDAVPGLRDNNEDRCQLCKRALYSLLIQTAQENGFDRLLDGSNTEDNEPSHPGAAVRQELSVCSPLAQFGFTKNDIRFLSARLGLPSAYKPTPACLASRIPFGTALRDTDLRRIDEAESALSALGLQQVRVRLHGNMARIEVPTQDIVSVAQKASQVANMMKACGFQYVTLDLNGYRSGSLNTKSRQ